MTETMTEMREFLVAFLHWYCKSTHYLQVPVVIPDDWWPVVEDIATMHSLEPGTVMFIMSELIRRWGDEFAPLEVEVLLDDALTQFWDETAPKA